MAATIFPIFDIVSGVAGDELETVLILPSGASPHTFEPSPTQMSALKGVRAVLAIGYGADDWAERMATAVGASVIQVDQGIDLLSSTDEHDGLGTDPHYWLSPQNAKLMATNVAGYLSQTWPASAVAFQTNLEAYLADLDQADRQATELLTGLSSRKIVAMHDAWYYFARHFNLEVVGTLEPSAGREPTPQYLASLAAATRAAGTKTLYSEPQLSTEALKPFLEDNGLTVAVIDPLGGQPGRSSLPQLIVYDAQIIAANQ